jgi:CO/xanthine dehydrogenase FAD-binding subunit
MKTALSTLVVERPKHLDEALGILAASVVRERTIPIAGGTDLFVYLNAGTLRGTRYLDLGRLRELRGIEVTRAGVVIRALTTFYELRMHRDIRRRLPSLAIAASEVGALQIQHRATIAGNIANASPAGDSLPVLLAHDAVVAVRSVRGRRDIPFAQFHLGYRQLAIEPDELITEVMIPTPPSGAFAFFRKVGTRRAQSISKVVFCGLLAPHARGRDPHVRLAYGSVAPVPVRALHAEATLRGGRPSVALAAQARAALADDIAPIDDIRSNREYRLEVAGNVLDQFLRAADPRFSRR